MGKMDKDNISLEGKKKISNKLEIGAVERRIIYHYGLFRMAIKAYNLG